MRGLAVMMLLLAVLGCSRQTEAQPRNAGSEEGLARLNEAQILDWAPGPELRPDEVVTRGDAARVAARLVAYGTVRLVECDQETRLDDHIRGYLAGLEEPPDLPGVAPGDPSFPYLAYVGIATPDGAGDPIALCEGLTRAELVRVANEVLSRIIDAGKSDLANLVPPTDEEPDYDFGTPEETPPQAPPEGQTQT